MDLKIQSKYIYLVSHEYVTTIIPLHIESGSNYRIHNSCKKNLCRRVDKCLWLLEPVSYMFKDYAEGPRFIETSLEKRFKFLIRLVLMKLFIFNIDVSNNITVSWEVYRYFTSEPVVFRLICFL